MGSKIGQNTYKTQISNNMKVHQQESGLSSEIMDMIEITGSGYSVRRKHMRLRR